MHQALEVQSGVLPCNCAGTHAASETALASVDRWRPLGLKDMPGEPALANFSNTGPDAPGMGPGPLRGHSLGLRAILSIQGLENIIPQRTRSHSKIQWPYCLSKYKTQVGNEPGGPGLGEETTNPKEPGTQSETQRRAPRSGLGQQAGIDDKDPQWATTRSISSETKPSARVRGSGPLGTGSRCPNKVLRPHLTQQQANYFGPPFPS